MTVAMKNLFQEYFILNETELFCSDIQFKVSPVAAAKLSLRDISREGKSSRPGCDERIYEIIHLFRDIKLAEFYQKVAEVDQISLQEAQTRTAYTVYFAGYFDSRQEQCKNLLL